MHRLFSWHVNLFVLFVAASAAAIAAWESQRYGVVFHTFGVSLALVALGGVAVMTCLGKFGPLVTCNSYDLI